MGFWEDFSVLDETLIYLFDCVVVQDQKHKTLWYEQLRASRNVFLWNSSAIVPHTEVEQTLIQD